MSPVVLRVDSRAALEGLQDHFAEGGFRVEWVGDHVIDVSHRGTLDIALERDEILAHLSTWQSVNPDELVTVVPYRDLS